MFEQMEGTCMLCCAALPHMKGTKGGLCFIDVLEDPDSAWAWGGFCALLDEPAWSDGARQPGDCVLAWQSACAPEVLGQCMLC